MNDVLNADVMVVGAGPVGLSLAMNLAAYGVRVIVAEIRSAGEPPNVRSNHVAARTMEVFRRLGLAQKVRQAGLPELYPNDIAFRTTMTGIEMARVVIPCRAQRYTSTEGPDTWWPTPEPPHRINQTVLEPLLFDHVARLPGVTILNRMQVVSFAQDADGVDVTLSDLEYGGTRVVRCQYMVGCDGARSTVRKQMGSQFEGTPVVQRVQSTYIRAPKLLGMIPGKPAWGTYSINLRRCGTVFAIDGRETWLIHNHLNADEPDVDSIDRDQSIRHILGVGPEFEYEIISKEDWVGRRMVADRFRNGRVFIAGDAAHIWVPYAGFGMNAGIADAINLSWLLAARLNGWAGVGILDAYEAERLPITEQVSKFAMEHAARMMRARKAIPEGIEDVGDEGDALRAEFGRLTYELNVQQFAAAGLNFGYFYDRSPIIIGDGGQAPAYTMGSFESSTVPGCRAPHFWLREGRSVYDEFGPVYTVLRFSPDVDVSALMKAADDSRMPLKLIDVDRGNVDVPPEYAHALLMCRADQHVVWRGDELPKDAAGLVAVLCGR